MFIANPGAATPVHFLRLGPRGGVPIVFIHALGLDLSVWDEQIRHFGKDHDVIAIDLPGHGLSAPLPEPPGFTAIANHLLGFLDAVAAQPVHLVGISVGGMIAQTMAVIAPARVQSLILVATSCTFPEAIRQMLRTRADTARQQGMAVLTPLHLERWFPAQFRAERLEVLDRFKKILLRQPDDFHADMWDMVATLALKERIAALTCPVLVVAGAIDASASPAAGQLIVDQIAKAELRVMPNCGHFPQIEYADEFNALLHSFLANA